MTDEQLKEIVKNRLLKFKGVELGDAAFDDNAIKVSNLESAWACLSSSCSMRRSDIIGYGTQMVHCGNVSIHRPYKFNVAMAVNSPDPVPDVNGMTELYK